MQMFHWTIVVAALLAGCEATGKVDSNPSSNAAARSEVGTYETYRYGARTAIPDGDPTGVLIGPLRTSEDGTLIGEVVLELDLSHSYTGDVAVELCYDINNDGKFDVQMPIDLFRIRNDAFTTQENLAYPMQLKGSYFFRDDNPIEAENWKRATRGMPVGSELAPSLTFSVLRGLRSGGSFYLATADTSARNTGSVNSWSVLLGRDVPGLVQHGPRDKH